MDNGKDILFLGCGIYDNLLILINVMFTSFVNIIIYNDFADES